MSNEPFIPEPTGKYIRDVGYYIRAYADTTLNTEGQSINVSPGDHTKIKCVSLYKRDT